MKRKKDRTRSTLPSGRKARAAKKAEAAAPVNVPEEQITHFANRLRVFLKKANGRPVPRMELASKCRGKGKIAYLRAVRQLLETGEIAENSRGYLWAAAAGYYRAVITRVTRTFGFAKSEETGREAFITGHDLCGALPGDTVLLRPMVGRGEKPEAAVSQILQTVSVQVSGTLIDEEGTLRFQPDTLCRRSLTVTNAADWTDHIGDKVLATVTERGARHSEHIVRVDLSLGSANSARACADALAAVSGAPLRFSEEAAQLAYDLEQQGITEDDLAGRLDLREGGPVVFTIDGAGAKDLDDAVSIEQTADGGYRLGVHIADVSRYVTLGSVLDSEAMARGTSIYYADRVIPMLPKALSNGICSLHPEVDRLTFSALLIIDKAGELADYTFRKSAIRSQVKGVYSEVNALLEGTADDAVIEKYVPIREALDLLNRLRAQREAIRKRRGAPSLETAESAFAIDENGVCIGVTPRTLGIAESMIEESMLLANEAAAKLAKEKHLPFVYRAHAVPPAEKAIRLSQMLDRLGIPHPLLENPTPANYAKVLVNAASSPLHDAVHQMVLRSMSKADYQPEPIGHFGLALKDYTHFTSPIRRYPDLAIHRILSTYIENGKMSDLREFAREAAHAGSAGEQRALGLERDCEDCYCAEWALAHLGEEFDSAVSGVSDFGIYAMLENTVEGMLPIAALPEDEYVSDGFYAIHGVRTNVVYALGQKLRVRIVRADISSRRIDFALA